MSAILRAISAGFPSQTILNQISRRYPQYANAIETASAAGYTSQRILQHLDKKKVNDEDEDQYLTEHEKIQKRDVSQRKRAALEAVGTLGIAGAVGAAGYAYATRNRAIRGQVLPPLGGQPGQGPGGRGGGLPPPQGGGGIPYQPRQQQGQQPQSPVPQQQSRAMQQQGMPGPQQRLGLPAPGQDAGMQAIQQNVNLVRNLREDDRFTNIIKGTDNLRDAAGAIRKLLPKSKVAVLDKAEGGIEKLVQDYATYLQFNPPAVREEFQPKQVQQQRQEELQSAQEMLPQINIRPNEQQEEMQQGRQEQLEAAQKILPQVTERIEEQQPKKPINERIHSAAFDKEHRPATRIPELRKEAFYVPNYRYPGEDPEEFAKRKILYSLVNKGAKALLEGKSFLDYPINEKAIKSRGGYSTARDVLLFMGDIPNIYDPLLDDDEKDELMNALYQTGDVTVPGIGPSKGERNIHGAQLAPNLVWNLLLSIEPKLATMEKPPSVKGYKMAPGKKMGTAELRRFLTHSVYGVLSGKTVSSELADKIGRISKATSHLDSIVQAAHDGNLRKMDEEMEKLMDDDYFAEVMQKEVEDMLMSSEQQEEMDIRAKEDTKMAAALKAKATRKKNKIKE